MRAWTEDNQTKVLIVGYNLSDKGFLEAMQKNLPNL
jgi:hypothetical protein